jgi:hypothetical protein
MRGRQGGGEGMDYGLGQDSIALDKRLTRAWTDRTKPEKDER